MSFIIFFLLFVVGFFVLVNTIYFIHNGVIGKKNRKIIKTKVYFSVLLVVIGGLGTIVSLIS
jgi:hypothetical protein